MAQYASVLADPWRSLAAGVVLQALEWWCAAAGVDADAVAERFR